MERLQTRIRADSPDFQKNRDRLLALVAELKSRSDLVRQGGGERYVERHRSPN